jgi:rubrerythrin
MDEAKATEILKHAILLEMKGRAFYSKVAEQASGKAVKAFFEMMAEEEVKHVQILSDQFKAYQNTRKFNPTEPDDGNVAPKVLTRELKEEMSAASYEAAAISAAMSMEENAIQLYSGRSAEATDPNEKKLYQWLADWEKQHLQYLSEIDRDLTEQIWYDNNFWPF